MTSGLDIIQKKVLSEKVIQILHSPKGGMISEDGILIDAASKA